MSRPLGWLIARSALLVLCLNLVPAGPAVAATASELFADGNRLFRDDLYWAALLRYREAADAGMDTPLLNYNTGVAHYRAKQHVRARNALEKAAAYAPLTAISHYNLGLNAYQMGDNEAAMRWFRRARDQNDRRDINILARRALRQLQAEMDAELPTEIVALEVARERKFTDLELRVRVGAGMDDNVFRSPEDPYADLTDPLQATVTPEVQSGFYVPVNVSAKYQVNSLDKEGFFGLYRFGGRFYQDKNLSNGDELLHELGFGSEYQNETENGETRVYSAFKIAQHQEVYYDPDNGLERDVGGFDISDRLSYLRYGPEFWAQRRFGALTLGASAKGQLWNYEEVQVVPEYDHEFWTVGLNGQYQFTPTSLLRLTSRYYTRRFGDRPAFELDGTQPLGNPTIRYDYIEYGIEARQRITNSMWFSVGYTNTDREDRHVGYNDFLRDAYNASFHLQLGRRFDLEIEGEYSNFNYANAFAFHEPTAGRKTLEMATGRVVAKYRMTQTLDLIAEFSLHEVASNDTRIQYDRTQSVISVRWAP